MSKRKQNKRLQNKDIESILKDIENKSSQRKVNEKQFIDNMDQIKKKRDRTRSGQNVEGIKEVTGNNSNLTVRILMLVIWVLCFLILKIFYLDRGIVGTSEVLSIYTEILATYLLAIVAMFALFDTKLLGKSVYYYARDLINIGNISNFLILNILIILSLIFNLDLIFILLLTTSIVFTTTVVIVIFIVNFEVAQAVDNTQSVYNFLGKNVFKYRDTTRMFWEDMLKISYTADEKSKIEFQILMDEIALTDFPTDDLIKKFLEQSNKFSSQDDIGVVIIKKFINSIYLKRIDFIESKKAQKFENDTSSFYFDNYYENKLRIFTFREFYNLVGIIDKKVAYILFIKNIDMISDELPHPHADQNLLLDSIFQGYENEMYDYRIIRLYNLAAYAKPNQIMSVIKNGVKTKNRNILEVVLKENLEKRTDEKLRLQDVFEIFGLIEGARLKNKEDSEYENVEDILHDIEDFLSKQYINEKNKELKDFEFRENFSKLYKSYIQSLSEFFVKLSYDLKEDKHLNYIVAHEAKRINSLLETTRMNPESLSKEDKNYLIDVFQNKNFLQSRKEEDVIIRGRKIDYYENILISEHLNKKYNLRTKIINILKENDTYDFWYKNLISKVVKSNK